MHNILGLLNKQAILSMHGCQTGGLTGLSDYTIIVLNCDRYVFSISLVQAVQGARPALGNTCLLCLFLFRLNFSFCASNVKNKKKCEEACLDQQTRCKAPVGIVQNISFDPRSNHQSLNNGTLHFPLLFLLCTLQFSNLQ